MILMVLMAMINGHVGRDIGSRYSRGYSEMMVTMLG